jgi:hypothetical protein
MPMLSGRALRAQLVTAGQRELFDYWIRAAGGRKMPARSDLDPLQLARLLPHLGLIDVRAGLEQACYRLAGTGLRDIYGQEITGKRLDELCSGERADYWRRVHARVAEGGLPLSGVVRGPTHGRDHVVLFWLRLPLAEDGNAVDRILCYDLAGPVEGRALAELSLLRRPRSLAAAAAEPRRCFG